MRKGQALNQEELEALPTGARVTDWENEILFKQEDGRFKYEDGGYVITAHVLDQSYGMAHYYDAPDVEPEPVSREESKRLHPSNGATVLVFDGPPGHQSGRFIEAEDETGRSIKAGAWSNRGDGTWELRLDPRVEPEPAGRYEVRATSLADSTDTVYTTSSRERAEGVLEFIREAELEVFENDQLELVGPDRETLDRLHASAGGTAELTPQKLAYLAQPLDPEAAGRLLYSVNVYENATVSVPGPVDRDHLKVARALRGRADSEQFHAAIEAPAVTPVTREEAAEALGGWLTDEQVETRFPVAPPLPADKHAGLRDRD